jgi:hypothetical protein
LKQNLIKKTAEFSENLAELDAISAEFEFKWAEYLVKSAEFINFILKCVLTDQQT